MVWCLRFVRCVVGGCVDRGAEADIGDMVYRCVGADDEDDCYALIYSFMTLTFTRFYLSSCTLYVCLYIKYHLSHRSFSLRFFLHHFLFSIHLSKSYSST